MKKISLAFTLCIVSIFGFAEGRTLHTGQIFFPKETEDNTICHIGWETKAPIGISEIYMIDNETARLRLTQANMETTYYVSKGDKIYFYYFMGTCVYYSFYNSNQPYAKKIYTITELKNNEITITMD